MYDYVKISSDLKRIIKTISKENPARCELQAIQKLYESLYALNLRLNIEQSSQLVRQVAHISDNLDNSELLNLSFIM